MQSDLYYVCAHMSEGTFYDFVAQIKTQIRYTTQLDSGRYAAQLDNWRNVIFFCMHNRYINGCLCVFRLFILIQF